MISHTQNPFSETDPDRREIWTMLVERDIDAFLAADWAMVDSDFRREGFLGLHAHKSELPDSWRLDFPDLETYRDEWLRQATASQSVEYAEPVRDALFRATNMRDIDLKGDSTLLHKKFEWRDCAEGWRCRCAQLADAACMTRLDGRWKITGFVGYMPFSIGKARG